MAFKLEKGEFKVKCRHEGCPFETTVSVKQNIMGLTEDDVESETIKFAIGMAKTKHDAIYGAKHQLENPLVKKVNVIFQQIGSIGGGVNKVQNQTEAVKYKEFKKGEYILNKGEIATTICEVVKGSAYVNKTTPVYYKAGDSFGAAALLVNQVRTADVIANEDGTTIAFYNLKELSKKDPKKAKELYTEAMEDMFNIIENLEEVVANLQKELEETKMIAENRKQRIEVLEEDLLEITTKLSQKN